MSIMINAVTHPHRMQWWEWGKLLGILTPLLLLSMGVDHLFMWAVAAHLFVDFTSQSTQTVEGKINVEWRVLLYHAFIAGGYAGLIIGGLPGLAISVLLHLLIDATNKFGVRGWGGPILDQSAHLMTLIAVWYLI